MAIGLAVISALSWGASDFLGGAVRREIPVFVRVAVAQLIGLVALAPVLIARGVPPPADPRLLFACLAGLGVTLELRLVYMALSQGNAFITAPVGALGATLAVTIGLIGGDRLDLTIALGVACALLGGAGSAWTPRRSRADLSGPSIALTCLGAAAGVGATLSCLHAAGRVDPYWATAVVSASTALAAGIVASLQSRGSLRRRRRRRIPSARALPALTALAVCGTAGDLAYAAASRDAALTIVSAIASLYPAATILLGMLTQGRRARPIQSAGIVLALAGAALLGAAQA